MARTPEEEQEYQELMSMAGGDPLDFMFDEYGEAEEDTGYFSNVARGMGERATEYSGSLFGAAEDARQGLTEALGGDLRVGYNLRGEDSGFDVGIFTPEETKAQQSVFEAIDETLTNVDLGYEARYTLERMKEDPSISTIVGFGIETLGISLADMAGMYASLPLYFMARENEMAEERAINDGRKEPNFSDYAKVAPGNAVATLMDKWSFGKLIDTKGAEKLVEAAGKGALTKEVGKRIIRESATEGLIQEPAEYLSTTVGTKAGVNTDDLQDVMLGGAVGGAFGGGLIGGPAAVIEKGNQKKAALAEQNRINAEKIRAEQAKVDANQAELDAIIAGEHQKMDDALAERLQAKSDSVKMNPEEKAAYNAQIAEEAANAEVDTQSRIEAEEQRKILRAQRDIESSLNVEAEAEQKIADEIAMQDSVNLRAAKRQQDITRRDELVNAEIAAKAESLTTKPVSRKVDNKGSGYGNVAKNAQPVVNKETEAKRAAEDVKTTNTYNKIQRKEARVARITENPNSTVEQLQVAEDLITEVQEERAQLEANNQVKEAKREKEDLVATKDEFLAAPLNKTDIKNLKAPEARLVAESLGINTRNEKGGLISAKDVKDAIHNHPDVIAARETSIEVKPEVKTRDKAPIVKPLTAEETVAAKADAETEATLQQAFPPKPTIDPVVEANMKEAEAMVTKAKEAEAKVKEEQAAKAKTEAAKKAAEAIKATIKEELTQTPEQVAYNKMVSKNITYEDGQFYDGEFNEAKLSQKQKDIWFDNNPNVERPAKVEKKAKATKPLADIKTEVVEEVMDEDGNIAEIRLNAEEVFDDLVMRVNEINDMRIC